MKAATLKPFFLKRSFPVHWFRTRIIMNEISRNFEKGCVTLESLLEESFDLFPEVAKLKFLTIIFRFPIFNSRWNAVPFLDFMQDVPKMADKLDSNAWWENGN